MPVKFVTAEEEYAKNKDLKKEDIKVLQEWLATQTHLPAITEFQMILFAHSCFYDIEQTKLCIENYFTQRRKNPKIFADRDPSSEGLKTIMKTIAVYSMPKKTPNGYSVIFKRLIDDDYRNYVCKEHMKLLDMMFSLVLHQEGTSEGNVLVFDLRGLGFAHFFKIDVFLCKIYAQFLQEALPFRLKGIHLLNGGGVVDKLLSLLKMVMSKQLFELMQYHNSYESLYEFVPKECLPEDIGGYCKSTEAVLSAVVKNLEDNRDFFLEEEKMIADNSKQGKGSSWFWK